MLETAVAGLPVPASTNTGNRNGFQTGGKVEGEDLWVEVELAREAAVDMVVLMPALTKGAGGEVAGFGFPRRFLLEVFDDEGESRVLMDETGEDYPNPRLYPVVAECPASTRARRVRLTATESWQGGGPAMLALAEMAVMQGNRNVALRARVNSSSSREIPPTWSRANLVDMVTPLGLPVAPGKGGLRGWHSGVAGDPATRKQVTVDLGRVVALEEIRLVPASRGGVPRSFEYGLPARFRIEASEAGGQGAWSTVYDRTDRSLQTPGGNLQCFRADGVLARFVRVSATRLREWTGEYVFALGELQAYAGGRNVAQGAQGVAEESLEDAEWGLAGLTDGKTGAGRLVELPQWFRSLGRRQELVRRQAEVARRRAELLVRAEHWLVGTSAGATCGIAVLAGLFSWRGRRQRRIELERNRERLARDLHDELGSNLGSIALISSFALQGQGDPGQMRADLEEIERVARESADSMRDMVALLGGKRGAADDDWLGVLRGLADRLLRGVELECRLPDGPLLLEPDLETRREVYLFCKEVLHNIARHARASKVRFDVRSAGDGLRVLIADDGCGFNSASVEAGHGMGNLRERAAGLRARMDLLSSPGGGTIVTLDVPRGRRWRKSSKDRES